MASQKPKLIVFDLDYTLWPFWVDTHVLPPFKDKGGHVVDSRGEKVACFSEVQDLLQSLKEKGFTMAVASRSDAPAAAKELMKILDIEKYFTYCQIYPGCKVTHFKRFHEQSGIPYKQMLFFDDEFRNIKDISNLGVTCKLINQGFNKKALDEAMTEFSRKL